MKNYKKMATDSEEAVRIYTKYGHHLELATAEEKIILRRHGYQVDGPTNKINYISQ